MLRLGLIIETLIISKKKLFSLLSYDKNIQNTAVQVLGTFQNLDY